MLLQDSSPSCTLYPKGTGNFPMNTWASDQGREVNSPGGRNGVFLYHRTKEDTGNNLQERSRPNGALEASSALSGCWKPKQTLALSGRQWCWGCLQAHSWQS